LLEKRKSCWNGGAESLNNETPTMAIDEFVVRIFAIKIHLTKVLNRYFFSTTSIDKRFCDGNKELVVNNFPVCAVAFSRILRLIYCKVLRE